MKYEVRETTAAAEKWLQQHLEENDWWILKARAKWLCKELNIVFDEPVYNRNVHIWLPEERWVMLHGYHALLACSRMLQLTASRTTNLAEGSLL
jgi:hypothetical protein